MTIQKYRNHIGTAYFDVNTHTWHGKVGEIGDLVTFKAATEDQVQTEFESAVDDYIATRAKLNEELQTAKILPLCSPFPGMDEPWSEETMAEFGRALDLYEQEDTPNE